MKAIHGRSSSPLFVIAGAGFAALLAAARAPAAEWTLNGLSGFTALVAVAIAVTRLLLGPPDRLTRRFWQLTLVLLVVVAIGEFGGSWFERAESRFGIDGIDDSLVLLAAFAAVWLTTTRDHAPPAARRLLWAGFALQLAGAALDIGGESGKTARLDPMAIDSAKDLLQFLSLQLYLIGAVMFVAALRSERTETGQVRLPASAIRGVAREPEPLGRRIRHDLSRYVARGSLRGFFRSRLYIEGIRPVMFLVRAAWCLWKFGRGIAASGRPLTAQAADMLRLGWRDGIDPILYPTLELYRPERRQWDSQALSRFEIGSGMLRRLHKLRPTPHGARINLGDKLAFHETCRRHGLRSASILIHARRGELRWLDAQHMRDLDRDLFVKPRQSRGARNSFWLHRVAPFTWQTKAGEVWSLQQLLAFLERSSWRRELLLQAMLVNHPSIADLADRSLIALRVVTAMDAGGTTVITHAMLRVISKLEPGWRSKREYAAPIDLETGRLGMMCNDKDLWPGCWIAYHPVTKARVEGRVLDSWPAVRALALAAHRVFSDRMLVGWDIALTPDGAVLLEGNSYPDVHFLQRVHQRPIGMSALGPLLSAALDQARIRDRHMTGQPS